jgi:hypothetical protein
MPPQISNLQYVFSIALVRSIFLQDQQLRYIFTEFFVPQRRTKHHARASLVQKLGCNLNTFLAQPKSLKKVSTNTPYLLAKTFVVVIKSSIMPTANKRRGQY